jgi:hypothetical protein
MPPTLVTLEEVAAYGSVAEILAAGERRKPAPVEPTLALVDGRPTVTLPDGRVLGLGTRP